MKYWVLTLVFILSGTAAHASAQKDDSLVDTIARIHYHCASQAEGQQLLVANTEYYNSLTQMDLDWRMAKTGATKDELTAFAQTCVQEFSDKEKEIIARSITFIENKLHQMGAVLPFPQDDVVFVKTTMKEECGAGGYTHKTEIYLGAGLLALPEKDSVWIHQLIAHELFHCLTRNSPEFRRGIYKLIGFNVADQDYVFAPAIQDKILTNPDVEHIDNYAEFTINGEKRNCALVVLYTKTWEEAAAEFGKEKAIFFYFNQSVLVPIDQLDTFYPIADVPDFWDVVGRNTQYVFAPEECLADNFAFAVVFGQDDNLEYESPQLIADIINFLKNY